MYARGPDYHRLEQGKIAVRTRSIAAASTKSRLANSEVTLPWAPMRAVRPVSIKGGHGQYWSSPGFRVFRETTCARSGVAGLAAASKTPTSIVSRWAFRPGRRGRQIMPCGVNSASTSIRSREGTVRMCSTMPTMSQGHT